MPSIKPKLQGYLSPEIHSAFLNWQEERGIQGSSEALEALLIEYFGFNKVGVSERGGFYGIEQIKEIIQKECELLIIENREADIREIKKEVSSKLPSIPEINQRVEIHCQEWMDRKSEGWMFKLGEQFLNRIHLLEQEIQQLKEVIKPDISHPLPESAEESPQDSPQSPLFEEGNKNNWKVGDRLTDSLGNFAEIVELGESGLRVNWIGGSVPNPPTGKGIWYDWTRDKERIAKLEVVALASSYSLKNLPKKGDALENNFGKRGQIIKIWPENPKYEIQWDGLTLPKRHDLADLEVLGVRRIDQPVPLAGMKQNQLEQRLDVKAGTLSRRRSKPDFKEWSREHDPDQIAWQWDAVARRYLAVE